MESKSKILDFDEIIIGSFFVQRRGKKIVGKIIHVIEVLDNSIRVELEGLKGQVFTLTRESVNRGKYSFL